MFWGRTWEDMNGMKDLQLGVLKGYDASIFREYAPDVKSFLEDKAIPNSVTICVGKISHPGKSSNLPELQYVQSLLPKEQWKNIKLTLISPSWVCEMSLEKKNKNRMSSKELVLIFTRFASVIVPLPLRKRSGIP